MVAFRPREEHFEPAGYMSDKQEDSEFTLKWAEQQYTRGLEKLSHITPVTSLTSLTQGDVLISGSGNARAVLKIEKTASGPTVTFLSRLRSSRVALETASQSRIDLGKLDGLVRRRGGNPLEKYAEIAKNLEAEKAVFHNVKVLLQSGQLGGQIRSALSLMKKSGDVYVEIDMWVSIETGEIEQIGGGTPDIPCRAASLTFNCLGLPAEEYIKSARFDRESEPVIKKCMLPAAVLANTLENARNLAWMSKVAGR